MGRAYYEEEAVTYNNRAVLRYLRGDLRRAAEDANRALSTAHIAAFANTAAVISARQQREASEQ